MFVLAESKKFRYSQRIGRVLLPLGEGGPKGRMRVDLLPSPAASRHPLPEGEGPARLDFRRLAKRNWDRSPSKEGNIATIPIHSPACWFPRALRDRGYERIQTGRRKIDRAALFRAEITRHQKLYNL